MPVLMRSLNKLTSIIDEELSAIECEKLHISTLAPKRLWKKTGRWDKFGSELVTTRVHGKEYLLCPTHEESVSEIVASFASNLSYKQLPVKLYQVNLS